MAHIRQRLWFVADRVSNTNKQQYHRERKSGKGRRTELTNTCSADELADAELARLEGYHGDVDDRDQPGRINTHESGSIAEGCGYLWLPCPDGKYRPVEPAPERLDDGLSDSLGLVRDADSGQAFFHPLIEKGKAINRTIRLKGYGNAIVPQVAAEVISAYMEGGI